MPAGTITALRAQAKDPQRVNLFVDGTFALGISLNTISQEKLYVGKVLSEADFARLDQAEQRDKALHTAMGLLEVRPRSVAELRERLLRKDFSPEACDRAIERLRELGMLDDAAFARQWVENRQTFRPRGASALRDELRRKGVDRTLIEDVLSSEEIAEGEPERARQIAQAALRKYAGAPDRSTFQRKLGGYLQRRGFSFATIAPILDQLWAELKHSTEEQED